jgi:hypothetical protein
VPQPATGTWAAGPVVAQADLGDLGAALSLDAGESMGIYPLTRFPGWLAKVYRQAQEPREAERLDRLVALPDQISPPERDVLRRHTSWPVARITDHGGHSVGCVIPQAPDAYRARFGDGVERFLDVDFLAKPDDLLVRRGLPAPTWETRLAVCVSLASIGTVLERNALVYSDWSYSNAFWSTTGGTAFVIDIDGIGFRVKPNMSQPNWHDPLTPASEPADSNTDRYRMALLIARCLTAQRELPHVLHALAARDGTPLYSILLDILLCTDRRRRPTVSALHAVMSGLPYVRMPVERMALPPVPVPVAPRQPVAPPGGPVRAAPSAPTSDQVGVSGRTLALIASVIVAVVLLIAIIAAQ